MAVAQTSGTVTETRMSLSAAAQVFCGIAVAMNLGFPQIHFSRAFSPNANLFRQEIKESCNSSRDETQALAG